METIKGNLFDSTAECLVNPTNSVGVMGKGLAKEFASRYPRQCHVFNRESIQLQNLLGGHPNAVLIPPLLYKKAIWGGDKSILMFPTKRHWKNLAILDDIDKNMQKALQLLEVNKVPSVAFPLLGCGLGGLDKEDVLLIFERHQKLFSGKVEIYEP